MYLDTCFYTGIFHFIPTKTSCDRYFFFSLISQMGKLSSTERLCPPHTPQTLVKGRINSKRVKHKSFRAEKYAMVKIERLESQ